MDPALGGCARRSDALLRRDVPALRPSPQHAQVVRHGVHKAPLSELPQPFAERGGGNAPKAGQFVHRGQRRGAEQQQRLLEALAQGTQGRVRPQTLQIDDDFQRGRFYCSDAPADGVQDGGGHGAPHVALFKETPEGVAGHTQVLGCLPPSMPPHVGAHVVPDGPHEVRSGLCRAVQGLTSWLRYNQSTAPVGICPTSHCEHEERRMECLASHCVEANLVVGAKGLLVRAAATPHSALTR